jgi:hypothetical protein
LSRQFDLKTVYGRVVIAGGEPVQLDEKKGFVFRESPEAEALARWTKREFLDVERNIAKQWRRSLMQVDFDSMVRAVMGELGHWRKPQKHWKTRSRSRILSSTTWTQTGCCVSG